MSRKSVRVNTSACRRKLKCFATPRNMFGSRKTFETWNCFKLGSVLNFESHNLYSNVQMKGMK
jgi:hypothetical protein